MPIEIPQMTDLNECGRKNNSNQRGHEWHFDKEELGDHDARGGKHKDRDREVQETTTRAESIQRQAESE
jgi:hypothetical protein